jgi:hypothetical protein
MKATVNQFLNDLLGEMCQIAVDGNGECISEFKTEATAWVKERLLDESNDREIVIEDLNCKTGVVYQLMDQFLEAFNEKYDLGFSMWDVSMEEYLRMTFAIEHFVDEIGFGMFTVEEINAMLYFKD